MANELCKIVYFDENSVTDYMQIQAGGELTTTSELLESSKKADTADGKVNVKAGIGGIFKTLLGFSVSGEAEGSIDIEHSTSKMANNILKNTILTDFLISIEGKEDNKVEIFDNYKITVIKDTMSYFIMVSPYFSMLKGEQSISNNENINVEIEKIDQALKYAKGYYEFLGKKGRSEKILRFNIDAMKNNYKINDILKMSLNIYAIKVGTTTLEDLKFKNELKIDEYTDNPDYEKQESKSKFSASKKHYPVYDVLLAGVCNNDK